MSGSLLQSLIDNLRHLPGVGAKSAQRMAYYLLQHQRARAASLGRALLLAADKIQHCTLCHTLTETSPCDLCADSARDAHTLCVVETPTDQLKIEQTSTFRGLYFVLMGRLSPLDGIGPKDLALDQLITRATNGVVTEVVLATNFTNEGEATAHYISEMMKSRGIHVSRLARGVPAGGELEYVDVGTVARAMLDRRET